MANALHCENAVGSQGDTNAKVSVVQEDAADRGKPHAAPESPGFRKAKHISFLAKQNMLNNVFHEAEPHWQSLLL